MALHRSMQNKCTINGKKTQAVSMRHGRTILRILRVVQKHRLNYPQQPGKMSKSKRY